MGRGGDAVALRRTGSFDRIKALGSNVKGDLAVLKTMWFSKSHGESHADRLETFYAPQADAYDRFRKNFLWGREPLLAACAARLRGVKDVVWVDLGGGTGENVQMMNDYFPVKDFKKIYVVDLCHSLCQQAQEKVKTNEWTNVKVVEADACKFTLPENKKATLITFSYSLSMIPPFHEAVDQAMTFLDDGDVLGQTVLLEVTPASAIGRALHEISLCFRSIFDMDNIDIGPERRNYLDCKMDREWEVNGQGSIPYVPLLRVPWYVWIGRKYSSVTAPWDSPWWRAPPMFPPTFLYTMSWEDPDVDASVLDVNENDEVYSVDCNPAQSALLELKAIAIKQLDFEDVWKLFGEGKHEAINDIYKKQLAPFMTQNSIDFWNKKLYHFNKGLYYAGGMGKVCWMVQYIIYLTGMTEKSDAILHASTLEEQRYLWDQMWFVRFFHSGHRMFISMVVRVSHYLVFNRFVLWFGGGVPAKQYRLILNDGYTLPTYLSRTIDGVARYSHLKNENYFYYNCLKGNYLKHNCPAYLREENFKKLKTGLIDRLRVLNGNFNEELALRQYSKVILMDHVDWLDETSALRVIKLLSKQVVEGGRIIFRSASLCPPYVKMLKENGFHVTCVKRADQGGYYMDKVNMYNSFYVGTRMQSSAEEFGT